MLLLSKTKLYILLAERKLISMTANISVGVHFERQFKLSATKRNIHYRYYCGGFNQ